MIINRKTILIAYPLLVFIIITLAIAPSFALGEGNRNLLLIFLMGLSPLVLFKYRRYYKNEIYLYLFMVSIILFPIIFNPESMRWSTVLYSQMFCITFLAYNRLIRHTRYFTVVRYLKILKFLIYAYFIVLIIQQFCVLTGLPIINLGNYNPAEPWKLNSLAAEPSHAARIVALLMFCYITIKELFIGRKYNLKADLKGDLGVWISFLWTMITIESATAFLFIPIVLLKFIRFRNIIPLMILLGIFIYLINALGLPTFERTYQSISATLTFNEQNIIAADHSASVRIVPIITLAKMVNISTIDGWFGHGIDYVSSFMYKIIPGVPEGISGGGLFQLWMEYGFISFILFFFFSLKTVVDKNDYLPIVFWFLLVFIYGVNSQIVWLCIILLFTNHFILANYSKKKNNANTKDRSLLLVWS